MTKTKLSVKDKESILFAIQQVEDLEKDLNKYLNHFTKIENKEFVKLVQTNLNDSTFSTKKLKSLLWTVVNTDHKNYISNTIAYFFNSSKQFPYWWRNYNILKNTPNPIYVFFVHRDIQKLNILKSVYKSLQFYLNGGKIM